MNSESGDHTGGRSSQTNQQPGTTSSCLDAESSRAVDGNENKDTADAVGNGSNEDRDSSDVDTIEPKSKPESNSFAFSFKSTNKPEPKPPTFFSAPSGKPDSNPPIFSFGPTDKPDLNQPTFSFAPTSKPESNPPTFSFAPTGNLESFSFSFAPTSKSESNRLTYPLAPTSKPESNPPNLLLTSAGKLSTSTSSSVSAGKQESNPLSSFNLQSGLGSSPNPLSFCSNAEFAPLAERRVRVRASKKCPTSSSPSRSAKQDRDGVSLSEPGRNVIQKTTSSAQQDGGRDTGVPANRSGLLTQANVGRPATSIKADELTRPGDRTVATLVMRPSTSQEAENSFAQLPSSNFFFSHPPPTVGRQPTEVCSRHSDSHSGKDEDQITQETGAGEARSLQELLLSAAARLQERENENGKKSEAERAQKDQKIQELERQLSELQSKHGEDHLEWESKLKKKDDFIKNQQAAIQEIKYDLQRCRNELQSTKTTLSGVLESEKAAQIEKDNVLRLKEQDDNKILQLQNEMEMHTDSFKELLKTNLNLRAKSLIWKAVACISSRISGQLQESSKRATEELEEKRSMNQMLQSVLRDALDNAAAKEAALLTSSEDFHRQNATLQQQLEDSVARCAELEQAASSLQTKYELSQGEVQQLSEECRRLEEEKQIFAAKSRDWEQHATFYRQEGEEKQLQMKVLEAQKEAAIVQMKETGKNHVTLQLQLRQAEVTVNELRKEIETKNQQLRESEAHMEELTSQKLSQELELQVARITITSLENNVTVAETEIQKLRETLAAKQEEIETGSRKFMDIATQNTHLQAELEMKGREIMRYRVEADRARNDAWVSSNQRAWSDDDSLKWIHNCQRRRNQTY